MSTKIPVAPKPAPKPVSGSSSSSKSGSSTSSSSSGGGGVTGYEKRQNAKEKEAQAKAAAKYRAQAKTLQEQADSIKKTLANTGFLAALNQRIANAQLVYKQQDAQLMEGFGQRVASLKEAEANNEKAAGDTSFANLINSSRERHMAVGEAMSQGAGESDLLKSQMMSLRNWSANQSDSNRSFFDSLQSINSSITDLNVDTKTARYNAQNQLHNDKDQLYTQYFNQKSQGYTQLGNIRGQQAELYGLAAEQANAKANKADQSHLTDLSGNAFDKAAEYATKSYVNPGISAELREWKGQDQLKGYQNSSNIANAATNRAAAKKPEGATLRKWDE